MRRWRKGQARIPERHHGAIAHLLGATLAQVALWSQDPRQNHSTRAGG